MPIDILAALEADGRRMHDRAKAGRIKDWCPRAADGGRAKAGWVKARDTTPTRYLTTPHPGPPQAPPSTHCGEGEVEGNKPDDNASECAAEYGSDGIPSSGSDPSSDSSGEADYQIHQAQTKPNSIISDTQSVLKLMINTWESILGRYKRHGDHNEEAMPAWEDFRQ